jgi:hypothetical protein
MENVPWELFLFDTKKGKNKTKHKQVHRDISYFTVSHLADSTRYSMNIALASAYRAQST